jgi:hypothetical protein
VCNAVVEAQVDLHLGSIIAERQLSLRLFLDVVSIEGNSETLLRRLMFLNSQTMHAMPDQPSGPNRSHRSQRRKQKTLLQKTSRQLVQITGAKDPRKFVSNCAGGTD